MKITSNKNVTFFLNIEHYPVISVVPINDELSELPNSRVVLSLGKGKTHTQVVPMAAAELIKIVEEFGDWAEEAEVG